MSPVLFKLTTRSGYGRLPITPRRAFEGGALDTDLSGIVGARIVTLILTMLVAPLADAAGVRLSAQSISVSAVSAHVDNPLLDDMIGGGFVVESPVGSRSLALRLGATGLASSRDGRSVTCAGFTPPGQVCTAEPTRTTGKLYWGLVGISGQLYDRSNVEIRLAIDALAGNTTTRIRGRTSGRELRGSELLLGGAADATLRWFPRSGRWGVGAGAGYSAFAVPGGDDCVDCYLAFQRGFGAATGTLGVTYRGK
ncbi:MAG TPA: hypothetical protein VE869_17855 [Gemmatimonas sp.]|nr:hypothetical protein [Gemmatimonas sp.]